MPTRTKGHRDHGRGTLILEKRVAGVGRIKVASGTSHAQTFTRLKGMLETLRAMGRLDLLRAIQTHVVTPLEVWDRFRTADLDRLPSAETIRPLWTAWETWRRTVKGTKDRDAKADTMKRLRALATATATVEDLPGLVRRYREACDAVETPRAFNLAKAHVQAFLRDTLGKSHHLYAAVKDTPQMAERRERGHPFPVREFWPFLDAVAAERGLPTKRLAPRVRPSAAFVAEACRAMALTGMGPGEYWGRWEIEGDGRLRVYGTKRKARYRRLVPLVEPIQRPGVARQTVEDAVARVSGKTHEPYDFRRTFAHLMEEAGIPRSRRIMYMGHGGKDVTDLYEAHEVETYLAEDREKLRAYLARVTENVGENAFSPTMETR